MLCGTTAQKHSGCQTRLRQPASARGFFGVIQCKSALCIHIPCCLSTYSPARHSYYDGFWYNILTNVHDMNKADHCYPQFPLPAGPVPSCCLLIRKEQVLHGNPSAEHTPFIFSLVLPIHIVALFLCWVTVVWVIEHILYACEYLHNRLTHW